MKGLQERVRAFVRRHGLKAGLEARTLDLVSEVGELAKEVLQGSGYGRTAFIPSPDFAVELGDVFFSLMCVANAAEVDLEDALNRALTKYEERIGEGGTPDSPGD